MPSPSQIRDELQQLVLADLLGPAGGPEEIVEERTVRGRYLVGMLAPKGQSALLEESETLALGGADSEDGTAEAPEPKAATMLASSIGLTFTVAGEAQAIRITSRWGRYERIRAEDEAHRREDGTYALVWKRVPVEAVSDPIPLKPGRVDWFPTEEDQPEVVVQGLIRHRQGQWIITLFLVNAQKEPKVRKDAAWLFQPQLVVEAPDGAAIFRKRSALPIEMTTEEKTMAMLYRHRTEFAIGHNVAVQASVAEGYTDRAVRLSTQVMPAYDVPQATPPTVEEIPALAGLTLDMKALAGLPDGAFPAHLGSLADAYQAWIGELAERAAQLEPDLEPFLDVAQGNIDSCRKALERIRAGLALLDTDPKAAEAFRFANRAMYLQRVRTVYADAVRRDDPPDMSEIDVPQNHTWYAFQLAFILLNLPALTDLGHPDRAVPLDDRAANPAEAGADLLWFPTGGGKTEAYLGLAAYAMAMRRLQGEVGGRSGRAGVAVLMRYTLRLLTLQQFRRAAALICACEVIRREDPARWGDEPFRIGLWVGQRTTPNYTSEAADAVKQLKHSPSVRRHGTPHQLSNCPWCGAKIEPGRDIKVETYPGERARTFIYCGDPLGQCPFSRKQSQGEGIPALVVDEEIYRRLPALLIATVDKFAQMPWNGRTAMLFGQVNGYCPRHGYRSPEVEDADRHTQRGNLPAVRTVAATPLRPPDLIIQDELHLISGPLGSLVGLYETAVDRLASWEVDGKRVRPKVIASTATVRQASEQVYGVFLRRVRVFPPQGLDVEDSFFARQREPSERYPGRRYLGICALGIRHKTALINSYVTLLAAAQQLYETHGADADPWMTLVGYFNSLRELGAMRRSVEDTIGSRLRRMDRRGLARRSISPWTLEELTSRKSAVDIPRILDRLEMPLNPDAGAQHANGDTEEVVRPLDVLLATNMLSVGVDVRRLGLMCVAGQPKNTAEYIQATSRIGRRHPGLVFTVYNWARPRDLSHYEGFAHYHATFYQQVEALSVTPFSPGATSRGLSALLVSLVRLQGTEFNPNEGASLVTADHPYVREAEARIAERAGLISDESGPAVRAALSKRRDNWLARIEGSHGGAQLGYRGAQDGLTLGLLRRPGPGEWDLFTCLNSLRNVEPTAHLILDDYGMDRDEERSWPPPPPPASEAETGVDDEEDEG